MKKCIIIAIIISISLFYTSCMQENEEVPEGVRYDITEPTIHGRRLAALSSVDDCDELLAHLKEAAIEDMEAKIDAYASSIEECGGCCYMYVGYAEDMDGGTIATSANDTTRNEEGGASEYSTTNNQVVGVDEADFIKNDGSYIYILADNKFQIIKAWPPGEAETVSKVDIEGIPKKLFISSDRALVYSSGDYIGIQNQYPEYYNYWYSDNECTYGYDCDFTGDNRRLKITVYDISDRSNPSLLREIRFSGSFINARRIGKAVHTVIISPTFSSPDIKYWPDILQECWYNYEDTPTLQELLSAFEELKQTNREIIDNSTIIDWIPSIEDVRYEESGIVSDSSLIQDCSNFYETNRGERQSFLTVFSLDIDQMGELHQVSIVGRPGAAYASSSALYIAARQQVNSAYGWFYEDRAGIEEASMVHKFRLQENPARCEYAGSGVVKGRVLNQFSMDEYDDHFRIATTTGHLPSSNVHSTLTILKEDSEELRIVGQVDNIAPSEDIRSVRFDDSRAFIVTFKKTDPLFAFNLIDPTAPRIEGELKIPGYSTYMHLMDENHLLTIGYDADDVGDFAWFQGIMLQIFDVSDMSDPQQVHEEVIGTRGSTSEAATNHLAFNYFSPKDLLAIPITICEGEEGGSSYGTEMTFSGLLVYNVTVENGFAEPGRVSHVEPGTEESAHACYNWWTNSHSIVQRSIFMDDYVYSVALDEIRIQSLDNLGNDICVIDLTEE
ncbi:MAG: beta-propeller domain-containing protein [bacterium]